MTVRPLAAADVALYRTLRLSALRSDPGAFGSTLDRELAFDDEQWVARLVSFAGRPGTVLVDEIDGSAAGMAGVGLMEEPTDAMVWGMWVDPDSRRSGTARRLLDATVIWARAHGAATVTLWVMRTNAPAISLYRSSGFRETGDVQIAPSDPCADELAMRLVVGPGTDAVN